MYDKTDFIEIATSYIKRDGIKELLEQLDSTDFYTAPASTRFHDSVEGGLVHHTVKVWKQLEQEVTLHPELNLSDESVAIVALFHDLCKTGFYKVSTRNVKDESGKWIQVPYYEVDDKFPMGHGFKSVYMVRDFMKLTTDEALAIAWHMNGFVPKEDYMSLSKCYETTPLAVLLAVSDLKASYL